MTLLNPSTLPAEDPPWDSMLVEERRRYRLGELAATYLRWPTWLLVFVILNVPWLRRWWEVDQDG